MQQKKSPESTPEKEQAQAREIILGEVQEHFAELVWANEPIASGDLVRLCEKELKWKKPTTYTVLRKLCEKGLLQNVGGIVTSRISREAFYASRSTAFVEDTFGGSLPAFIASFISRRALTAKEAEEIRRLIDSYQENG